MCPCHHLEASKTFGWKMASSLVLFIIMNAIIVYECYFILNIVVLLVGFRHG